MSHFRSVPKEISAERRKERKGKAERERLITVEGTKVSFNYCMWSEDTALPPPQPESHTALDRALSDFGAQLIFGTLLGWAQGQWTEPRAIVT